MLVRVSSCVLVLQFVFLVAKCEADLPVVKTPLGLVRGQIQTSFEGRKFAAFEGIPFAKPPIGDRRFEKPEPIEAWIGTWNATFLTECAQTVMYTPPGAPPQDFIGNEDCLYVNVYVPHENPKAGENLEVIVHIHGGAYMYGSGHGYAKPEKIMDRDVIFVTFNYRVGVLGFLSTEDDVVPGNNGLKDQSLVLKWIKENIASFGGNPNSITLTGLSAGGSSVHLHYFSKLSANLFQRGFAQSGTALNSWSIQEEPLQKTKRLAAAVGCPTDCTKELISCLKQRPFQQLLDKVKLFFSYLFLPCVPFGPVVEKGGARAFLDEEPYTLLKKGEVLDVPLIASVTTHEGLFPGIFFINSTEYLEENWNKLAPVLLEYNNTIDPAEWDTTSQKIKEFYFGDKINQENFMKLVDLFTDRYFAADAETAVRLQSKVASSPVYYMVFGYPGDNNPEQTVTHGGDAKYYFGASRLSPLPLTENEVKMKNDLLDMLVSYAKTNKPTFQNLDWKPTHDEKLTYLKVKSIHPEENKVEEVDELTTRAFWNSLKLKEGENL